MDVERLLKRKQRAKRDGNARQRAEITKELGDLYFETGKPEYALQEYLEQLEICDNLKDKLSSAVAHRMIGEIYANLGDYEQALVHQNYHLEGAKEMQDLLEEQRAYATLGRTYFLFGESLAEDSEKREEAFVNAKKAYSKSVRLCNELENMNIERKEMMTMRARSFLNLGLVLEAQKEHEKAIDLIVEAADLCKDHNLKEDFHRTQIALGAIYERQSNFELSFKHLESAAKIEDASLKAEAQVAQAELLLKSEKWRESRKILVSLYVNSNLPEHLRPQVEKNLRIVATLHEAERALTTEKDVNAKLKLYETLGDAATAAQCFKKAVDYYRGMLECAEECKSDRIAAAFVSLAQTLKDAKEYTEALEFARKELRLCTDPREICRSAVFLAELLVNAEAPEDEIRQTYELASKNAKACNDASVEASVTKDIKFYLENSGKFEEAKALEEKLKTLKPSIVDADSDEETENENIGADICLDDLSDVENELKAKENIRTSRRRGKKGPGLKINEKGESSLHVACINGNIDGVEKLLATGHPVDIRDNAGWTPLHEAANYGHVEIGKLLLEKGANVNDIGGPMCQGVTPLHDAATCGNVSMMRLLIQHGANVTLQTTDGETVLDCLEQWKSRAGDLSAEDLADYKEMHEKLCAIVPRSSKKGKKKSAVSRVFEDDEDDQDTASEPEVIEKISAGEDYKRTIASLKHRGDPIGTSLARERPRVVRPLVDSDQVLVDDWLEDDIGSPEKRTSRENCHSTSKRKSMDNHENREKSTKRQKMDVEIDNEEVESLISEESRDSDVSEVINIVEERRPRKRKQQVSLLSIGFTRDSTSRTPSPIEAQHVNFEPRDTVSTETITLNVLLEGKTYKIEVEVSNSGETSMKKILDKIQSKFWDESGCRAKLDLKTTTGTTISSENISRILRIENTRNLRCEVIEMETPPIVERYGTICKTYNTAVREFVSKCLKSCENTSILRLKQEDISREELVCILKTLEYEKNVQVLRLSGGELHGAGKTLNDCIAKLSSLQELYLEGCDIDFDCLSKLETLPPRLKLLDLSYNPLGSKSQQVLRKLLSPLKQLQTLNLRYCLLDGFRFTLDNCSLVNLDISWNCLGEDGVCCFLQRQLLNLNLSNTTLPSENGLVASILKNSNFSFENLESLELSSCDLSDSDVETILPEVSNLTKFVLGGNKRITVQSSKMLLKHKPTLKYIDVSGCSRITKYPDSETHIENPGICTFVASMEPEVCDFWVDLWRGKGYVTTLPQNLAVFKPFERSGG